MGLDLSAFASDGTVFGATSFLKKGGFFLDCCGNT
jgi:hypothetical protein